MIPLSNFKNFSEAGQAVLKFLSKTIPFKLWMITRTEGRDWIILQTENHGYEVSSGDVLNWGDSFCVRMIEQGAPRIAPRSNEIDLYQEAPINQNLTIQAYIGQPLLKRDGSLFGTLCAIDPEPQSEDIVRLADLIELLSKLLSSVLQAELNEQEQIRKTERLQIEASTDYLTRLFNRRAWDELVILEEERCKHYGNMSSVVIMDLNNLKLVNDQHGHSAGDQLIKQVAALLNHCVKSQDIVARLGGDEFGIILVESNQEDCQLFKQNLQQQLQHANISASIGTAVRHPTRGLQNAIKEADMRMYEHKKAFKQKQFHLKNRYQFIK